MNAPIGIFDSGIGGLSVLQALRAELPQQDFIYIADSGHAPYGERDDAFVIARSRALTAHLLGQGIQALVIACNTATAATIDLLRAAHPQLPIIGVEPALKPAAVLSQTKRIGVMATRGTLASARFKQLLDSLSTQAEFVLQPCDGLAEAIEQAAGWPESAPELIASCARHIRAMGQFGLKKWRDGHAGAGLHALSVRQRIPARFGRAGRVLRGHRRAGRASDPLALACCYR
jgi:glutamate racemase